jgi:hypothetical protein
MNKQIYLADHMKGKCKWCDKGDAPFLVDENLEASMFSGRKDGTWSHSTDMYYWPCPRLEPIAYAKAVKDWKAMTDDEKENYYG